MIDWTRVDQLRTEVGAEDFDEVVALFLEEVDAVTKRLARAPNMQTLGEDMHFLKGSAMSIGFTAFADACETAENACTNGAAKSVELTKILDCYHLSRQQFLTELPSAFDS